MVQDIKELGPKLNVEGFRNSRNEVVFEDRKIDVYQARPYQRIPPVIAKQVHAGIRDCGARGIESGLTQSGERSRYNRRAETLQLDVVSDTAGIDRVVAFRS